MDTDGRPTTIIAADLGPPRAEISAGSPIGESIMNTGTGGVLFTNQPFLHPDDVSGLKVL